MLFLYLFVTVITIMIILMNTIIFSIIIVVRKSSFLIVQRIVSLNPSSILSRDI